MSVRDLEQNVEVSSAFVFDSLVAYILRFKLKTLQISRVALEVGS